MPVDTSRKIIVFVSSYFTHSYLSFIPFFPLSSFPLYSLGTLLYFRLSSLYHRRCKLCTRKLYVSIQIAWWDITDTHILTLSWPVGHIRPIYTESFQVRWNNSIPLFLHAAIYLEVSLFRWTSQNAFSRETAVYKLYCEQCCYAVFLTV